MRVSAWVAASVALVSMAAGCKRQEAPPAPPAAAPASSPPAAPSGTALAAAPLTCPPSFASSDSGGEYTLAEGIVQHARQLGRSEAEVEPKLGTPLSRVADTMRARPGAPLDSIITARYPAYTAHYDWRADFGAPQFSDLLYRDRQCALAPGVAVGRPVSAALALLGDPNMDTTLAADARTAESGDRQVTYDFDLGTIRLIVERDTIQAIIIELNDMN